MIVFFLIVCIASGLYAWFHIIFASVLHNRYPDSRMPALMIFGSIGIIVSVFLKFILWPYAAILAAIFFVMTWLAAFIPEMQNYDIKPFSHILRALIVIFLSIAMFIAKRGF